MSVGNASVVRFDLMNKINDLYSYAYMPYQSWVPDKKTSARQESGPVLPRLTPRPRTVATMRPAVTVEEMFRVHSK